MLGLARAHALRSYDSGFRDILIITILIGGGLTVAGDPFLDGGTKRMEFSLISTMEEHYLCACIVKPSQRPFILVYQGV